MSVYTRFKKRTLRYLVEFLEFLPQDERDQVLSLGMLEDPGYTHKILEFLITFEAILKLPDVEFESILSELPLKILADAAFFESEVVKERIQMCFPLATQEVLKQHWQEQVSSVQSIHSQRKCVLMIRALEKQGKIQFKKILSKT